MMEQRDFYQTLGVGQTADAKEIRESYRRLAFLYHPDQNKDDPSAGERMKAINEAYAVLSDPAKRREYDSLRQAYGASAYGRFRQSYSQQDIFRGSDINQIFEEMGKVFGFRGVDDVFREFYGSGYRSFEFRTPGGSGRGFVFNFRPGGPQAAGQFPQSKGYPGKLLRYAMKKLWGVELPEKGEDRTDRITISAERAEKGGKILYVDRRNGKEFRVTLPQGVRHGRQIRLKGMGEEGRAGAEPGDLFITVRVRKPLIRKLKDFLGGKGLPPKA